MNTKLLFIILAVLKRGSRGKLLGEGNLLKQNTGACELKQALLKYAALVLG